jgi:upstream activation factor subunit UAF30
MVRKLNPALKKPLKVSADLEAVVGKGPMPRMDVVKNLWVYIKKNGLQDATNRRNINADDKLQKVFGGKKVVNMFEMTKLVSKHLTNE